MARRHKKHKVWKVGAGLWAVSWGMNELEAVFDSWREAFDYALKLVGLRA